MHLIQSRIHVPAPILDLPIFLCWRSEPQFEGDLKPRKVPYYANGRKRSGQNGSTKDRRQLVTYKEAISQVNKRRMSGIGIALIEGYNIVAVDVDNCVVDGKVPAEILESIGMTYVEYSPSGRGIRALLCGNIGNRKATATADECGFEVFSTSGFVTLTGNMLDHIELLGLEDTLAPVSPKLLDLCERRFGTRSRYSLAPLSESERFWNDMTPALGLTVERMQELLGQLDPSMGREGWIRVGMALHHECDGDDTGFDLWDDWSSDGVQYPGTEALRTQWQSFERWKGAGRRQITMATVIKMAKEVNGATAVPPQEGQQDTHRSYQRFPLLDRAAIMAQPPQEWLIKCLVPKRGLVVVFGPSQSGKSFLLLDMLSAIAHGETWFGYRVTRADVTYVMLEGEAGLRNRIVALEHQQGRKIPGNFLALAQPFDISDPSQVEELGRLLPKGGVTAIDTLNRSAPGLDENAAQDMGRIISGMKRLQELTEGLVICIHHTGKDASKGMRGHSSLHAALDAAIEVGRGEVNRWWRAAKVKDGADDRARGFSLNVIELGVDQDGDAITSCAIEATAFSESQRTPRGTNQVLIFKRLRQHLPSDGWINRGDGSPAEIPYDTAVNLGAEEIVKTDRRRRRQRSIEAIDGLIRGRQLIERVDEGGRWLSLN